MTDNRLRNRLIICWMMASAFWLAGLSIHLFGIRPAPGFAVVAPLALGVPAGLLIVMLGVLLWSRHAARRSAPGRNKLN